MWSSVPWPSREELYELVWSKPSEQVAAGLGVSGVTLTKRCAAWNIPKPPRGYWAKRAAGQTMKRPRLPVGDQPKKKVAPPPVRYDAPPVNDAVPWPQTVKATEHRYRDARVDVWGRLEGGGGLDVMVSREALPRALQLYALIISGLQGSPISLVVENGRTLARARSDEVRLRIKEQVRAQPGLPQIEGNYASSGKARLQQRAIGTGRLHLLAGTPHRYGFSNYELQFRDGKVPLEGQLEQIVAYLSGIEQSAAEQREVWRREEEARLAVQRRQTQERARIAAVQAELERRQREELACREGLFLLARRWEETERLRVYLRTLDQELPEAEFGESLEYRVWRAWAEEQVALAPQREAEQLRSWATRVTEMKRWAPIG